MSAPRRVRRAASRRYGLALGAAALGTVGAACARTPRRPSQALPNHSWHTVKAGGGPTYTFRAGQQAELTRDGTTMSGTYQFPTDSAVALTVTGLIPGMPTPGPTTLTLRFDVRVLPDGGGHERVEFRAGTAVDTLARVD